MRESRWRRAAAKTSNRTPRVDWRQTRKPVVGWLSGEGRRPAEMIGFRCPVDHGVAAAAAAAGVIRPLTAAVLRTHDDVV